MATVSELKEKARAAEQAGQVEQALKIYQHVLKHFEGSPGLIKVLPLYVKVGDLHLREGRTSAAVSAYEAAAKEYAIHGAAQRVDALCNKIERVDPVRADSHARLAQKLLDHGHAGSARDVLAAYADKAGLGEVSETLDDLAGRPMNETEPILVKLLAAWGAGAAAPSEQEAARLSTQLQMVTDQEAGDLAPAPAELEEADVGVTAPVLATDPDHPPTEHDPEPERTDEPEVPPRPETFTLDTVAPVVEMVEPPPAPMPFRDRRDERVNTSPRLPSFGSRPTPILQAESKPKETRKVSVPLFAAGLAGALMVGFVAGRSTAPAGAPGIRVPAQVAAISEPTPPPSRDPIVVPVDSSVQDPAVEESPADTADTTASAGSANVPEPVDVLDPPGTTNPPPAETPPASSDPEELSPVVVDGLEVLSVSDAELRGQAGFRVVHMLDDGGRLTVESYLDTTATTTGRVTVLVTEPDTVVGIIRIPGKIVYASGVMPEDSLRALMERLVVRR